MVNPYTLTMTNQTKEKAQPPVITIWQILLIILIIILPAGGFYGGMKYQEMHDADKLVKLLATPTVVPAMERKRK